MCYWLVNKWIFSKTEAGSESTYYKWKNTPGTPSISQLAIFHEWDHDETFQEWWMGLWVCGRTCLFHFKLGHLTIWGKIWRWINNWPQSSLTVTNIRPKNHKKYDRSSYLITSIIAYNLFLFFVRLTPWENWEAWINPRGTQSFKCQNIMTMPNFITEESNNWIILFPSSIKNC